MRGGCCSAPETFCHCLYLGCAASKRKQPQGNDCCPSSPISLFFFGHFFHLLTKKKNNLSLQVGMLCGVSSVSPQQNPSLGRHGSPTLSPILAAVLCCVTSPCSFFHSADRSELELLTPAWSCDSFLGFVLFPAPVAPIPVTPIPVCWEQTLVGSTLRSAPFAAAFSTQ